MQSETTRFANEQLLNNLEEGVLIVEKDCSSTLFLNTAAKRLISHANLDMSIVDDPDESSSNNLHFDWDKDMFAEVSKDTFTQGYNVDHTSAMQQINKLSEYQSIKNIVQSEREKKFPAQKRTFKVKSAAEPDPVPQTSKQTKSQEVKSKFISIKVKPQPYHGEQRVALFINDRTNKVYSKL